jgi:tyrosyl-tRNA synthetase
MEAKLDLARRLTALYHDDEAADAAASHFQRVVRDKAAPTEIPALPIAGADLPMRLLDLALATGAFKSNGEARRRIKERGVRVDGEIIDDPFAEVSPEDGAVLRVSKRAYFKITLQ